MPIYDATKRCAEAFPLKDEDFMKGDIVVFIRYQFYIHVYNRLLDVWQTFLANLKKNMTTYVAEGFERYDRELI